VLLKAEANRNIGFATIRKAGNVVDDPMARGQPGAITFKEDRDRVWGRPPDYAIIVTVRD
jgi:hypothetical protein